MNIFYSVALRHPMSRVIFISNFAFAILGSITNLLIILVSDLLIILVSDLVIMLVSDLVMILVSDLVIKLVSDHLMI